MKAIMALCWLGSQERIDRYAAYLEYYLSDKLRKDLGHDKIIFVDNASPMDALTSLGVNIYDADTKEIIHSCPNSIVDVYRYNEHLPRAGMLSYPYCWRAMIFMQSFIQQNSNISSYFFIDSDVYILTPKLANFFRDSDSGMTAFWNSYYGFPTAELFVLCKDAFHVYCGMPIPSFNFYDGKPMESLLPFTKVIRDIDGGRYGEKKLPQTKAMQYYAQWSPDLPKMVYNL